MEELDEVTGGGAGGLEDKLIGEGEPGRGALEGRVDAIMDINTFQNCREN